MKIKINKKRNLELNKIQFQNVLTEIGEVLQNKTNRFYSLSAEQKLKIGLHWLGNGGQYHGIADMHGVSKMTVGRCVHEVVDAVNSVLFDTFVKWPQNTFDIIQQFHAIAGFPHVCGVVDGILIKIDAPVHNEPAFVDRHHNHSINCMAVCGPDMKFYYISSNWPGSVHDARVLRNSSLNHRMEEGWRPHPEGVILGKVPLFESPEDGSSAAGNIFKCCATLCNFSKTNEDVEIIEDVDDDNIIEEIEEEEVGHNPPPVVAVARIQQLIEHFRQP
ncbi:putative nuclease HARBI1 [Armadillidium vulgare]|nr:putative nuclease HARBI1 [Armadillidium vulgare]